MKSPASKISFLFALYVLLHFAEACDICDCPNPEFPYIDYKNIELEPSDPNTNVSFEIAIQPDSVLYVAQLSPRFSLFTAAYGCSCAENGDEGDKYAPVSMDVFANRPFNDTLPAGASLRSIFWGLTKGDIVAPLSSDGFRPEPFRYAGTHYSIRTDEKPYLGLPYRFSVQWVKSNGDTLRAETRAVVFD